MWSKYPVLTLVLVAACNASVPEVPDAAFQWPKPADAAPDSPPPSPPDAKAAPDAASAPVDAEPPPDAEPAPPDAAIPTGPAAVIINELSPDFEHGHDLVELLVTTSGTADGIKLERDYPDTTTVLATLPDVVVYEGDVVVVHLTPAGTSAAPEALAKNEMATAHNFADAWDFLGNAVEIPYSNVILSIRAADGTVTSAVPFFRADLDDTDDSFPRLFPQDLQAIITEGLWAETCEPAPCKYSSNLADVTVSWLGAGTSNDADSATGASVARKPGGVNEHKAGDWKTMPVSAPFNSYGTQN